MLQANVGALNGAIKHIISRLYPVELRTLQTIKYFAQEYYTSYQPFNLPHIAPTFVTSNLGIYGSFFFAIIAVLTSASFSILNIAMIIDMWLHPALGVWSKAICVYVLILSVCALFFTAMTRFILPYRDYSALDEIKILEQINPDRVDARRAEIYRPTSLVFDQMRERGLSLPFEHENK
jgi:hypothetical protein